MVVPRRYEGLDASSKERISILTKKKKDAHASGRSNHSLAQSHSHGLLKIVGVDQKSLIASSLDAWHDGRWQHAGDAWRGLKKEAA